MSTAAERLAEFDTACGCPDPAAGQYEPCEAGCGVRVAPARDGIGPEPIEDDHQWGCHPPSGSHSHNWTVHTAERCRSLRSSGLQVSVTKGSVVERALGAVRR